MTGHKFDPKKLDRLNDPRRREIQDPDLIWDRLQLHDPRVLVEIGAGTGYFAFPFGRRMARGKLYALDIAPEMLTWMRDHMPPECSGCVIPLQMKDTEIPLPDGVADLAYMVNLHHELEDPVGMTREARRILKNGGTVMIIDWHPDAPFGPPADKRVDAATIRDHMEAGGFDAVRQLDDLPYFNFFVGKKNIMS